MKKIAIVGCGWLGQPLAEHLLKKNVEVIGTTRSPEKKEQLIRLGIQAFELDLQVAEKAVLPEEFKRIDSLFLNIPPSIRGAKDIEKASHAFLHEMEFLLRQINFEQVHLIVASSTSVYPDFNTKMDERFGGVGTPSGVAGDTLRIFERMCLDIGGLDTTIVRYGGLYGPGRHPVKFFAGKKDVAGGMQRVNMVSLDKCIEATVHILLRPLYGEIFNVVDSVSTSRKAFYTEAAKKLGLDVPEFKEDGNHLYGKWISSEAIDSHLN